MSQTLHKTILLIDYENVHTLDFSMIQEHDIDIKIFLGQAQNKVSIELVQATQRFGRNVEWIKIEGIGRNALDFHIAFYLGKLSQDIQECSFVILSKDKGFDPLIQYLNKHQINCKRIQNLLDLFPKQENLISPTEDDLMVKVLENLAKIKKNKRPRTPKTLRQHIKTLFIQKKLTDSELDTLIDSLLLQKKISEANSRLTYHF